MFLIIGVLAFLIGLIVRAPQRQRAAANGSAPVEQSPRWYEFTLALVLLAAIAAFAIWIISSGNHWVWGETIEDWRSDSRAVTFAAVMVALAVIGLVVSLIYALVQSSQKDVPQRRSTLRQVGGVRGGRTCRGGARRGAPFPVAAARSRLAAAGRRHPARVLDRARAGDPICADGATDLSGEPRRRRWCFCSTRRPAPGA